MGRRHLPIMFLALLVGRVRLVSPSKISKRTTKASWLTPYTQRGRVDAIIINAGAFTHYAWSLHDALATFSGPVIEVHISNPNAREPWRHTSVIAPVANGTIAGLGMLGYELAVNAVARLLK